MSNWYGTSRSNYVKIANMEGLTKALEPFSISFETDEQGTFFHGGAAEDGGWPSWSYIDDECINEVEFDPAVHICQYMADGEILVMLSSGAEKLRYVTGYAQAFNKAGDRVEVSINEIYAKAAAFFSVPQDSISAAEY